VKEFRKSDNISFDEVMTNSLGLAAYFLDHHASTPKTEK